MKRAHVLGVVVGLVGVGLAACGSDEPAVTSLDDSGEVEVTMVDIAYEPDAIEVPAGEEVTFAFTNDGKAEHEALIGTEAEQEEHETEMNSGEMSDEEMAEMDEDDGHEESAEALTLQPGESGSLSHTFDEPGEYLIGCHVPGHWEAGMKVTVTVT